MEKADDIVWVGDSEERFLEKVVELNAFRAGAGDKFLQEVLEEVKRLAGNVNLHAERENGDRVATLHGSGRILVYRKEYYSEGGKQKVKLSLLSVRKSY